MSDINKPLDPLLDLLVQNGVLDDAQVDTILEESKNPTGKTLRQLLIDGEYVMEDDLLGMMAAYQGCDVIDLSELTLDTDTVQSIPASVARMYNVLSVAADDTSVTLATYKMHTYRAVGWYAVTTTSKHATESTKSVAKQQSKWHRGTNINYFRLIFFAENDAKRHKSNSSAYKTAKEGETVAK